MKTTNVIERLCLFLFALVLAAPAWAQGNEISIGSKADWQAFCERVKNGETTLNVKLTQNIDLGTDTVMAGTEAQKYAGTFDGQGHMLSINWDGGSTSHAAPFRYVSGATIKNLHTQGKIAQNGYALSGLVGWAYGTVTLFRCVSDVNITGGGNWGPSRSAGMVQHVAVGASVTLTDCLVKGDISDNAAEGQRKIAGFVYEQDGTCALTRCLFTGNNNGGSNYDMEHSYTFAPDNATLTDCYFQYRCGKGQGEFADYGQLESGEITHRLQGDRTEQVWGQTLGTDNIPQLTAEAAKRVYEVKFSYNDKVMEKRYANSGQGISGGMPSFYIPSLAGEGYNPHHYYTLSFGGGFSASTPIDADRTVEITLTEQDCFTIATVDDWKELCNIVGNDEQKAIDVKMTQDIDLGSEIVMLGTNHGYQGTFDGQGYTLSFDWDAGSMISIAPFKRVDEATIKNLRTQGQITTNGSGLSGLVYAAAHSTFFRCVSDVKLTGGNDKRPIEAAGMIGTAGALDGSDCTLIDCIVKGSITNRSPKTSIAMAGLSFATYNTMTNCLYLGTNNAESDERNYTFGSGTVKLKNCHYLNPCGTLQGEPITVAQLRSGEVTYKLQAGRDTLFWGQTIGTDTVPLLTTEAAKQVYGVKFSYNGEVKAMRYANKGGHVVPPTVQELLGADYAPNITYALSFEGDFSASSTVTGDTTVVANVVFKDISIATKADWRKFCDRVNRGETTLNAKMTADVDLGEDTWQVGAARNYSGTFDGQGHTLTVNWNSAFSFPLAPFAVVENATIKNLHVKGQITNRGNLSGLMISASGTTTVSGCVIEVNLKSSNDVTGMINWTQPNSQVTITDCVVKGALNSDATNNMAGFVYKTWGSCTLTNCLYAGTNNAEDGYTFAPYSANLDNCYYLNPCGKAQGKQATKEQLASGEIAAKLQAGRPDQVWGQLLGTDTIPQLTAEAAKHVYEVKFTLNNEVKATRYANGGGSVATLPTAKELLGEDYNGHHYYAIAFEGGFNGSTTVNTDRTVAVTFNKKDYYEIASKADWKAFCDIVGSGQNTVDAKMTKDVDLGEDIAKVGTSNSPYGGTFDGQNHVLTVNWDAGSANDVAPFGRVKGSTIKNLCTEGSIRSSGYYLGGLIDESYGENTVTGCVSNVNLTSSTVSSWCGTGGLISYISTDGRVTISDCLVTGDINATTDEGKKGMGGFVYANNGTCTMNNCLYAGTNNGNSNASRNGTFTTNTSTSATLTLNNCHYLNPCGKLQGEQATKAQLESGYMAHLLQGMREETVWGQVLGTDTIPQLTAEAAKQVYEVKFTLNGKVKAMRYANRGGHVSLPTVQEFLGEAYNPANTYKLIFDGDFSASTPVNSDRTVAVVVAESYEIATKADWQAFCNRVNDGQTAINAKLMNDVDLSEKITMAGTIRNYNGTFDGQGHTLTLNWNSQSGEVALFKFVNNATIKNLRVNGKIKSDGRTLSALVCNAVGNVTLSGCVSEVDITSNYHGVCELAGMIAYVNDRAEVAITDCVVKGAFNSMAADKKGMAGFVYLQTGYCTLTNCLYAGTNNATAGSYTFGSNTIRKNCYYLNPCGKAQGERIVEKQLESGEVAYKLQGDRTDSCHWAQVLGEWPGLYREADKAKPNYVYYNKDNNGWACDDFRLTDGQSLPIGLDFTATKATYDRTLAAGKATLCLPYELPVQGFKAYTLADRQESRTAVHFEKVSGTLGAYRPYLLVADGTLQLGGENLQVKADRSSIVLSAGNYYFKGAVHDVVNWWLTSDHAYILQADGQFHKVTSDNPSVTVPAYRAYISYNSHEGAKPLSIVFDGETTGIYGTTDGATDGAADGAADGAVYNLQGQRVADRLDDSVRRQIPTGVYIVNGRKVVVK